MRLLTWIVATGGVVLVGLLAGLYAVLFSVVGRLPR